MELFVHESPEAVAAAAARRIADAIAATEGWFSLGLAGGSTPAHTYRELRDGDVEWSRVRAWLSDERFVPPDDPRSNGRLAYEELMSHVDAVFHRPRWSRSLHASDSAAHYEAVLRHLHPVAGPDLILLGLGADGHTASLFPGTSALDEDTRWFVANIVPGQPEPRLTATFPLLWRARLLMVLVVGEGKAAALKSSLDGNTPAGRLVEGSAEVEWHVDTTAASLVSWR